MVKHSERHHRLQWHAERDSPKRRRTGVDARERECEGAEGRGYAGAKALERKQRVQSNDAPALSVNNPEAAPAQAAFEAYRDCVAGAAGRWLPNNQESAAAIAEAAEPNCISQSAVLLDAVAVAFGPPASSAHADERYRSIRARVIKDVSVGIMQLRQEQPALRQR